MRAILAVLLVFFVFGFSQIVFAHPKISGLVEVEMASGNSDQDNSLATVEVAIDTIVNKITRAHVQFLYEEGATDFELDEGTITLGTKKKPYFLTAGQKYLSFGSFETQLVSDPLTLEIGEFRETAFEGSYQLKNFAITLLAFNGEVNSTSAQNEDIDQYGISLDFQFSQENAWELSGKLSYINALDDSDGLSAAIPANVNSHISGYGFYSMAKWRGFSLLFENIQALDAFLPGELSYQGLGAKPSAQNIELGYSLNVFKNELTIAVSNQKTEELAAMDLPKTRNSIGASFSIFDGTSCGLEFARDEDYAGTTSSLFTIQLATQF